MMIWGILAALLVIGLVLRLPGRVMVAIIALLWGAVFLVHLIMPHDHALAAALGGDWRSWGALGLGGASVLAYRAGLNHLRKLAAPPVAVASGIFSDSELERYARHIVLREIGGTGQKKLKAAKVLVIGAGGLGSPALLYLAAAGVGTIGVIDDDDVSNSNLQRQIIHTDARIGQPKVTSAKDSIMALNPFISVQTYRERLDSARAPGLFGGYDLILDGSDNFDTRYLVNAAAVAAGKPLISAAITQWEGQIGVFDPARGGPCYACVFPQRPEASLAPSCAEAGVIAPLPGVMGAMMALEAVKYLTGAGAGLTGFLLIYDGLWGESRKLTATRRDDCKVCGAGASALDSRIA